jgi:hypothetical protein
MTPEDQVRTLQRLTEQMDAMLRWQEEETAKADARQAQLDAERAGNKRAAFAAMAMQGLCVAATYPQGEQEVRCKRLALLAVMQADALIESLNPPHAESDGFK